MGKIMQNPEFVRGLAQVGAEVPADGFGPSEFAAVLKAEIAKTARLKKDAGIEPQ